MAEPAKKIDNSQLYQEFMDAPKMVIAEIIGGQLYTTPRPAAKHTFSASVLGGELFSPFHKGGGDSPGGWIILFEPELHLGDKPEIFVPDLAGWKRERMPVVPDVSWFDLPPDWVCEIISPSSIVKDRILKMPIYGQEGVEWLWLVDPDHKTLESYQYINGHWVVVGAWSENEKVRIAPFDAVEIDLSALWI